jgi:hypothetical protein
LRAGAQISEITGLLPVDLRSGYAGDVGLEARVDPDVTCF